MSSLPHFTALIENDIQSVEALMRAPMTGDPPEMRSALELVIAAGGKRIRPSVSLLVGSMLNAPHERLITMAAAIELLHNATLVHDDLIDGALLRRGIPTLNAKWTPAATVLAGDLLFARAAKLAADTESVPAVKMFSETLIRIVGGEVEQLLINRTIHSRADYDRRIYAKTGSLFETAACTAAMISPVSEGAIQNMAAFGRAIGMAFQIIDDILDFTADENTLGKPIGSDLRQGLVTLPALLYFEENAENRLVKAFLSDNLHNEHPEIETLISAIRSSTAITAAHQEARKLIGYGMDILKRYAASPYRQALEELSYYIVDRTF